MYAGQAFVAGRGPCSESSLAPLCRIFASLSASASLLDKREARLPPRAKLRLRGHKEKETSPLTRPAGF